jgi:predicted peptidase
MPNKSNRQRDRRVLFCSAILTFILISCCYRAASQTEHAPPGVVKQEPPFRKRTYTNKIGSHIPYRLFIPPGYDSSQKYPLILFFHGGTGRGSDNEAQISNENERGTHIWTSPENQAVFPAFVLAPQCGKRENWSDPELNEINPPLQLTLDILALVQKDYPIDPDRIYLVGQAMGGLGAWALLQNFPGRWAAAIIVASFDNFTDVSPLTRVPLWMFQWDEDPAVPTVTVREMVKQLKKAGGQPRYTEYHQIKTPVWDRAFSEPQLVPWLTAQKRAVPNEIRK